MILLIDSHVLVWWLADSPLITAETVAVIGDPANDVIVSAASVWELGIKRSKGKLTIAPRLSEVIEAAGFQGLPVTSADADAAAALPLHHHDPFDRMLVAQARRLGAVIVSRDPAFDAYGIDVLRA